jgi:hypothetical protein
VTVPGALHAVACGAVTAIFSGSAPEQDYAAPPPPKSFGVESLSFRFADGSSLPFAPAGQLFFSDWRFDVFSPDCAWTALLVDRFGPYHLVRTADLRGYLEGRVKPVAVQAPGDTASVHSDGLWTSAGTFEFFASCCGGVQVIQASTSGAVEKVFEAASAPAGVRRVKGGYEVVKPPASP